jgi:DNA-damage-inducible protein J
MMANTNINIQIDSEIKKQAEQVFFEFGINMTTAINIFLRQAIRENGLPFQLKLPSPNAVTIEAINEGRDIIKKGKSRFSSADNMFDDLGI